MTRYGWEPRCHFSSNQPNYHSSHVQKKQLYVNQFFRKISGSGILINIGHQMGIINNHTDLADVYKFGGTTYQLPPIPAPRCYGALRGRPLRRCSTSPTSREAGPAAGVAAALAWKWSFERNANIVTQTAPRYQTQDSLSHASTRHVFVLPKDPQSHPFRD